LCVQVGFGALLLAAACGDSSADDDAGRSADAGSGLDASSLQDAGLAPDAANVTDGDAGSDAAASDDAGTDDAGGPVAVAVAEFCSRFDEALCSWYERCNGSGCAGWGGAQSSRQECADALVSLAAGMLDYDGVAAASCVERVGDTECGAGPPWTNRTTRGACDAVFEGTLGTAAACVSSDFQGFAYDECENGHCVRANLGGYRACPGVCQPFVAATGDCTVANARCTPGLSCNEGICEAPRAAGSPCLDATCDAGLLCGGMPLRCYAPVAAGDDCTESFECDYPGSCIAAKCATVGALDDPCLDTDGTCSAGLYCLTDGGDRGVCSAPVAAGAPCDPDFERCESGYGCPSWEASPTCVQAIGALDEPCGPDGCTDGLFCDGSLPGTCHAVGGDGASCAVHSACQPGLLCMTDDKCHPPGNVSEPCAVFDHGTCNGDLFCAREGYVCTAPRAIDQTCNPFVPLESCQAGLYCACLSALCPSYSTSPNAEDVCAAQRADDQACDADPQCLGGHCISDKCASSLPTTPNCTR
jgi:hypothetical protein